MKPLPDRPAWEIIGSIRDGSLKVEDYMASMAERIEKREEDVHGYITLLLDSALEKAREIDRRIGRGEKVGRLSGMAVAVKDNICTKGIRTTCASKILKEFIPPYDATVVEKIIRKEDGIIVGKTNLDEFAMGTTTEFSAFGPTTNPWDRERVPGGSSGGSAAVVASGEATVALGSDTGGSIRCPAAFCSTVGLKPTYGLVSRYGLISYANSLEQIGPITKDVRDCALLLSCIAGHDGRDSTSVSRDAEDYASIMERGVKKVTIAVPKELIGEGTQDEVKRRFFEVLSRLEGAGFSWEEISLEHLDHGLAAYYIIAMSEASSNLARYDGIRYGMKGSDMRGDWSSAFSKVRRRGFGEEVKRRIILGTFALSAGYYDEYYLRAQKVRTLIRQDLDLAFRSFDVIMSPTMPVLPFRLGEKVRSPLELYRCDIDTVIANLVGIPALSLPCGFERGLPIGLQIMAPAFREDLLLQVASFVEGCCARDAR